MQKETPPKFCRDCKHHRYLGNAPGLRCIHPAVLACDPGALADAKPYGSSALAERQKVHAQCGKRGALWEPNGADA